AIDAHRVAGQADGAEHGRRKTALESKIVDGDNGAWPRAAVIVKISRRQRRLPIMDMHDVWHESGDGALRDVGAGARQGGKAQGIARPIDAIRPEIGIARAGEEMRRV